MDKLEIFKKDRSIINRHSSIGLDAARSKFEVEDRKIAGYPIVWGEKNDYDEIVMKGATLNSLNARGVLATKNPIVVLNQHRQTEILCRPTLLQEDDYGLFFEGEIITGVQHADEALAQIRQGVLKQLSYGFDYVWDDNKTFYDAVSDAIVLKEIKLWEISVVTFSSGESAQLRSYKESQIRTILGKYTKEQISDLQNLLSLTDGAATSTQEEKKEDLFTQLINKF